MKFRRMLGVSKPSEFGGSVAKAFWLYEPHLLYYTEELQVIQSFNEL